MPKSCKNVSLNFRIIAVGATTGSFVAAAPWSLLQTKKKHSAVESAISGLDVYGLDRYPGHGLDGLEHYVAF